MCYIANDKNILPEFGFRRGAGVRVSGGDLYAAEAPTEAAAETAIGKPHKKLLKTLICAALEKSENLFYNLYIYCIMAAVPQERI